jgi:protein-S-isoprenylcysteine O-methyltransferase Ste14
MDIIGKTTIHPVLFYTGKFSGYITWVLYLLSILNIYRINEQPGYSFTIVSFIITIIGLIISAISLVNLGSSTRLGLPSEDTIFKTNGIYSFSRNPMYLGFNILTIASVIYLGNIFLAAIGMYSIFIYHVIIRREEKFLENRFGEKYFEYKINVRRYL